MPGVGVLVSKEAARPEKTFWVRPDIFRELLEADSHEISRSDSATSTGEQMASVLRRYMPAAEVDGEPYTLESRVVPRYG